MCSIYICLFNKSQWETDRNSTYGAGSKEIIQSACVFESFVKHEEALSNVAFRLLMFMS